MIDSRYKYGIGGDKEVSPSVPTAKEDTHAVNLGQVEGMIEGLEIDDSDFVHKTGNETIEGEKEFTSPVTTNGIFLKHEYFPISKDGHTGIASNSGYINIEAKDSEGTSRAAQFILPQPGPRREYSLPNKSGTVALLQDLPDGGGTAITNITQIANRSYNDLQDLPPLGRVVKYVGTSPYTILPEDKDKFLVFAVASPEMVIQDNAYTAGDEFVGAIYNVGGIENAVISKTGGIITKATNKALEVINGGTFSIKVSSDSLFHVSGDLVEEYAIRQSPDGSLWKVSVDNSGNEVITAL